MKNFQWAEYWDHLKQKLLCTFPGLEEKDLEYREGNGEKIIRTLTRKIGITAPQLNNILFMMLIDDDNDKEEREDTNIEELIYLLEKDYEDNKNYYSNLF